MNALISSADVPSFSCQVEGIVGAAIYKQDSEKSLRGFLFVDNPNQASQIAALFRQAMERGHLSYILSPSLRDCTIEFETAQQSSSSYTQIFEMITSAISEGVLVKEKREIPIQEMDRCFCVLRDIDLEILKVKEEPTDLSLSLHAEAHYHDYSTPIKLHGGTEIVWCNRNKETPTRIILDPRIARKYGLNFHHTIKEAEKVLKRWDGDGDSPTPESSLVSEMKEQFKGFTIPEDDPRKPLRGQRGARTEIPIPKGAVLPTPYNGSCFPESKIKEFVKIKFEGNQQRVNWYAFSSGFKTSIGRIVISGLQEGNFTSLINANRAHVRCDCLQVEERPTSDTLHTLPLPKCSHLAYVRCKDQLFYINKKTQECRLLETGSKELFDILEFRKKSRKLSEYEIEKSKEITGHSIYEYQVEPNLFGNRYPLSKIFRT